MRNRSDGFAVKPNITYLVESPQVNRFWFVDPHEYWARESNFEIYMRTNGPLTKTFVEWNQVEVSKFPHCDGPVLYVPEPCWEI